MNEQPNLSYVHELSGGDHDFEKNFLRIVKRELPLDAERFRENIAAENFKEAAANVHKLKHKISILGLEDSHRLAQEYELQLREGVNKLENSFLEILDAMMNYLEKIQT